MTRHGLLDPLHDHEGVFVQFVLVCAHNANDGARLASAEVHLVTKLLHPPHDDFHVVLRCALLHDDYHYGPSS